MLLVDSGMAAAVVVMTSPAIVASPRSVASSQILAVAVAVVQMLVRQVLSPNCFWAKLLRSPLMLLKTIP